MKAKLNGLTVTVKSVLSYTAPDPQYNSHRTIAQTDSGVVLLEEFSKGREPGVPKFLEKLTDFSD